ncbi:hypothetical protein Cme02nite_45220 [Catellatospora methionotrophica]|uniref:Uncharacterized protein n=1 Tax=Catellatospora methionotrophica TaxID=121620 RepID=A0A8J3LCF1_9ACTN|nr:hypothetical protein [Catellatospora methionotrophica]GIG16190.1 hypothetical protein Cme02nite_45220 [Catellatospora methionotrophica]
MAKKFPTAQDISAEAKARGLNAPGRFDERTAFIAARTREVALEEHISELRDIAKHGYNV